jgi:DNA-3-methyladenine glycosylase II
MKTVSLNTIKPYDFALSLQAVNSFQPALAEQNDRLYLAARINENPALIEVRRSRNPEDKLIASSVQKVSENHIRKIAEWVLFAELDLIPFYNLASKCLKLSLITQNLYGLKPMRPVSLFEMAVIAIIEQQISLAAAYSIKTRLMQRFGEPIDNWWIFPEPYVLSQTTLEDLRSCGLSRQKAQYIHELATKIIDGTLDYGDLVVGRLITFLYVVSPVLIVFR